MLLNKRCTVCHSDIETDATEICGICGDAVHERCVTYEQSFECPDCADEPEIGAVEF